MIPSNEHSSQGPPCDHGQGTNLAPWGLLSRAWTLFIKPPFGLNVFPLDKSCVTVKPIQHCSLERHLTVVVHCESVERIQRASEHEEVIARTLVL